MTVTVGICDDHGASCSIAINNQVLYAASEERFSRIKNDAGFPVKALARGLAYLQISPQEIDQVVVAQTDRRDFLAYEFRRESLLTISDHHQLMEQYWKPKLSGSTYPKFLPLDLIKKSPYFNETGFYGFDISAIESECLSVEETQSITSSAISSHLGIAKSKVKFADHHTCHAIYATACFQPPTHSTNFAVVTVDSWGDGRNQTVWHCDANKMHLVSESSTCLLARIYRFTTLYLGMRPNEHEYKVMGLSAYSNPKYVQNIYKKLLDLVCVDGMNITTHFSISNLYELLKEIYYGERFDNIAGAVQLLVETTLSHLFTNIHHELGVTCFYYAGGVAMNVKANQVISKLDVVKHLFVPGAPDDQSAAIGASLFAQSDSLTPVFGAVSNMYLGPSIDELSDSNLKSAIAQYSSNSHLNVTSQPSVEVLADILCRGEVLGRVASRMEFGARALGNRSIFALPSAWENVDIINDMIKGRDFWMPFAGSVIEDDIDNVLSHDFAKTDGRFMTIAFDTNPKFYSVFKAATHRKDRTIRAQVVTKNDNDWYYSLLREIKRRTGLGVLLNTSFNLHGYPIVSNSNEALHVFFNSGLQHLLLGNNLISK